jgi:hypothetical protein
MTVDIKYIECFGFTSPKEASWLSLSKKVASKGWKAIDEQAFSDSLTVNVNTSYENIALFKFKDLDTDFDYICKFDNQNMKWILELPGSDLDAVTDEDIKTFQDSEEFKKFKTKVLEVTSQASEAAKKILLPIIQTGKFIDVDEIKLEAELDMLDNPDFVKSLANGKI